MEFPYPEGTLVTHRKYGGWCIVGHVYQTTSRPIPDNNYESGYKQSARCLVCNTQVGYVDAGWWRDLATQEDKQEAIVSLKEAIKNLEGRIGALE